MSTTCQTIVTRAKAFSSLNSPLTSDAQEMLSRIRADQRAAFSLAASVTRDYFQSSQALTSTSAVAGRTVDLNGLTQPLDRILKVVLPSGTEISQVDVLDLDAELAPRYRVAGKTLIEINNEWNTPVVATAVSLTVTYVFAPTDIDPTNAAGLGQSVSVPDEWIDLLVLPLAMYLVQKDPGRPEEEYDRIEKMKSDKEDAFVEYLQHYGGIEVRRFDIPKPIGTKK